MNGNDLMTALSGLDLGYIDEAALELHGKPQVKSESGHETARRTKVTGFRRYLPIVLPAAAAILLTVAVAMPMILRMYKGGLSSSTAPKSDSTGSAEAPALDSGMPFDEEETAGYSEQAAEAEVSEAFMPEDAVSDSAEEVAKSAWSLTSATYFDGCLIIQADGMLPADPGELAYSISEGEETVLAEGVLGDVLINEEPLTLDLTSLELPPGSYTLTIGDESIDFTVQDAPRE